MKYLLLLPFLLLSLVVNAQPGQMPKGRFYGKLLDATTGKGVEFATIRIFTDKMDSASGQKKPALLTGVITKPNGEFDLDQVPFHPTYELVITAIGYREHRQEVAFSKPSPGAGLIKDLGNIRIKADTVALQAVVVEGTGPAVRLEADKKVFEVSDNAVTAGGTGEDVLKNIPSVSVDMDGNVTMRNQAPQIFIDGRLTTMTIDQIPAEAIESVELISNPSAKYDASGGSGGIINIVLKKERKLGYHGSVRAGIDMRGKMNGGGDINIREGKVNFFAGGMINQRKSIGSTITERHDYYDYPELFHLQDGNHTSDRQFVFLRGGFDFFLNNRSTLTLSYTHNQGEFNILEDIITTTDTVFADRTSSGSLTRRSETERGFFSHSGSVLFKHLFPMEGRELTADVTYNRSGGGGGGTFTSTYPSGTAVSQRQDGRGDNNLVTAQADYVTPWGEKAKLEMGVRAAYRSFLSSNESFIFDPGVNDYILLPAFTVNYDYVDQVYAAYMTYSRTVSDKLSMQGGLRAESSVYKGTLLSTGQTFSNSYPVSLFPSASAAYKINDKHELQASVTRRVNRPTFFSLMPFTDYSDSLNIKRGNPNLRPEFSYIAELSYLHTYAKENTFMASGFYRQVNNLFSAYQILEPNPLTGRDAVITTTRNEGSAYGYGLELISRTVFKKVIDLTGNFTVYNAVIPGAVSNQNGAWAWYSEVNMGIRLPKGFGLQASFEYQSETVYQINDNGGGHGFGSQATATSQGFTYPEYEVDLAIRKDFFNRKLVASFSVSDVFRTEVDGTYTKTDYFEQEVLRRRDQQFWRFNLSYRFGKFDASIFRRKNTRNTMDSEGGF